MRRERRAWRIDSASYPRSPTMHSGRHRGRPPSPCNGGIESTSGKACCESLRLAAVNWIASGMPCPSQIRWRLLPGLARSVGFGPVCAPQKPPAPNNCRQPHATSQSGHHAKASSATQNGSNPKFRSAANRVNAANTSCRSHNLTRSATSARECHFGVRTGCL
jgi:hypothetical protein